jgi:hypothetical protein
MRVATIVGVLLIAGGLFILIESPTYSRQESLVKVGGLEAMLQRQHNVPQWMGVAALAVGAALVVVGLKKP